ncbi:MAG: KH domain-containing protein [Dehalococcoidales bacterium]
MSESEEQEEPQVTSEADEEEEPQIKDEADEEEEPKIKIGLDTQGESMKELIEYIAKSIVDEPDEVKVDDETDEEGLLTLKLQVADEDKGRVIGKQGRIAEAMRALLRVKAAKASARVRLEIV